MGSMPRLHTLLVVEVVVEIEEGLKILVHIALSSGRQHACQHCRADDMMAAESAGNQKYNTCSPDAGLHWPGPHCTRCFAGPPQNHCWVSRGWQPSSKHSGCHFLAPSHHHLTVSHQLGQCWRKKCGSNRLTRSSDMPLICYTLPTGILAAFSCC